MELPRLTIRRLMLAVLLVAVGLGGWLAIGRRRERFRQMYLNHLVYQLNDSVPPGEATARYHSAMAAKYEAAARRPWLPVPADPPEPIESPEPTP